MARRKRTTVYPTNTLLLLGLLSGGLLLVQGQVDQANARAVDGFSNAVVQAGEFQSCCSIKGCVIWRLAVHMPGSACGLKCLKEDAFNARL